MSKGFKKSGGLNKLFDVRRKVLYVQKMSMFTYTITSYYTDAVLKLYKK